LLKTIERVAILSSSSPLLTFSALSGHVMTRLFAFGLGILAVAAAYRWFRRGEKAAEIGNATLSRQWLTEFHAGDRT
jgi:hypothetical protein